MIGDVECIKFAKNRNLRTRFPGLHIGVESRNIPGFYKCVSKCLIFFYEIVMGLPFGVTGLRMCPDPALCVENELSYSVYVVYDQLLSVCHGKYLLSM